MDKEKNENNNVSEEREYMGAAVERPITPAESLKQSLMDW
jgi:hypothetical protein